MSEQEILDKIAWWEELREEYEFCGTLDAKSSAEIDAKITTLRRKLRELQTPALL